MQKVVYKGKIFEVVHEDHGTKTFEIARRSPGVRALIVSENKILLSREYRTETKNYDYRLPGGKVFDTLAEYSACDKTQMLKYAKAAVVKEVAEEVGLTVKNPKLIKVSHAGATIEWNLYYFLISNFSKRKGGQALEEGEDITSAWYSLNEVKEMCLSGQIQEDRSVAVLLTYILGEEAK